MDEFAQRAKYVLVHEFAYTNVFVQYAKNVVVPKYVNINNDDQDANFVPPLKNASTEK
jgi:hypothetical protein